MKRFIKAYVKKGTDFIELALGICEGTNSLGKFAGLVYKC